MKKLLFTITILFVVISSSQAQLSGVFTGRLQTVLDSVCNRFKIKGASAAVLVPGAGIWKGVHGESYAGHPITSDMVLGIGSNTKTFTSSLMLKLQEDGLVNLDDTIGTWIHGVANVNGQITIRQLLNHTSGLADYTVGAAFGDSLVSDFNRVWQPEEMLPFIDTPSFAPGASWEYCNTNYLLAGIIIKDILGEPINKAFHDYIFTPVGLSNTFFYPEDTPSAIIPHGWDIMISGADQKDLQATYSYANTAMFSMAYTAGAIMSTAEDNVIFWHKLISGDIISTTSLNQMLHYVPIGSAFGHAVGYGLGIFRFQNYLNGHTIYSHGGTNIGFINENIVDSVTGVTISVLTNQDSIDNDMLTTFLIKALHQVTLTVPPTAINILAGNTEDIRIYPNPASGFIKVDVPANWESVQLSLYDVVGRCWLTQNLDSKTTTINTSQISSGNYIIHILNKQGLSKTTRVQVIK